MSALWGRVKDGMVRAFQARCEECRWGGPMHFELDSVAVMYSAADSHAHNAGYHKSGTNA